MLPSDAPPNTLTALARTAAILAILAQPGVIGWITVTSRWLTGWTSEKTNLQPDSL
jgi:hypothetical protein